MKLILKEYLLSLKERGELDKLVLPNLLAELGLRVLNSPMIGTRQNGVDIAAVGRISGSDETDYLYLFCIKAGNISRSDWDGGVQSVRPELDEILDVYLDTNVAKEYVGLPVKICLCCGGEIEETVLMNWAGYTKKHATEQIHYEEWNGDRLADLMMRCLLTRELLEEEPRRNFQKALAMVNDPGACYEYSKAFLNNLLIKPTDTEKSRLLRLRQSYLCLHAITTWAIEAGNLESIYRISELGIMFGWNVARTYAPSKKLTKHQKAANMVFDQFVKLYLSNSELYFAKTTQKHAETLHALSVSVRSREAVDVNLALFELMGRLATRALWTEVLSRGYAERDIEFSQALRESTSQIIDTIVSVINNNPTLHSPFKDDHMIEIALVMYLAQLTDNVPRFLPWLHGIASKTTIALILNSNYPTCSTDYFDLLAHPASTDQSYKDEACVGSILYPYLYVWLIHTAEQNLVREFTERIEEAIPNCTHQAWLPDEETDELIWRGETNHGVCVTGLTPKNNAEEIANLLNEAIRHCRPIGELSAIKAGLLPLFLTACRHHRLPIPPHFWFVDAPTKPL